MVNASPRYETLTIDSARYSIYALTKGIPYLSVSNVRAKTKSWYGNPGLYKALCEYLILALSPHCTGSVLEEDHLQPLLCFVAQAASQWRAIGVALTFPKNVLDTIEVKNMGRPIDCFTDMLSRWLKWAPPKHKLPTLEMLADALREDTVGEERMAYNLEQDFGCKLLDKLLPLL